MLKNTSIIIHLNKLYREKAEAFATARCPDVGLYEKRGGFKREDIVVGALGEMAVYKFLTTQRFKVNRPDFTIHSKKSYDADLSDLKRNFHVKAQSMSSRKKYGASWLMQRSDPIIVKPVTNNYLVPCNVDLNTNWVEVHGLLSIPQLVAKDCIEECSVPWFRKYKVALYMETINLKLTKYSRWGLIKRKREEDNGQR